MISLKSLKTEYGLEFSSKLIGQIFGGLVFYFVYRSEGFSDTLDLFGVAEVPLGIFMACLLFLVSRFSNAVNLTDGIDGLVAGLGTISFGTYAIIAWKQQQFDVVIICLSVIGGLIGFSLIIENQQKSSWVMLVH